MKWKNIKHDLGIEKPADWFGAITSGLLMCAAIYGAIAGMAIIAEVLK